MGLENKDDQTTSNQDLEAKSQKRIAPKADEPEILTREQLKNKLVIRIIVFICYALILYAIYVYGPAQWIYREVKGSTFESINIVFFYGLYVFPVVVGATISAWGMSSYLQTRKSGDLKRSLATLIIPVFIVGYITVSGTSLQNKYKRNEEEFAQYTSDVEAKRTQEVTRIRSAFDASGSYYAIDDTYKVNRNSFDTSMGQGYSNKLLTTLTELDFALVQGNAGTSPLPSSYEGAFDDPSKVSGFDSGVAGFVFDVVKTKHTWSLVSSEDIDLYRLRGGNHNLLILVGNNTPNEKLVDVIKHLDEKNASEIELIATYICPAGFLANHCAKQDIPTANTQ